ncbi:hypothetical protein [Microbulbifer sp. A4B17]|nr:hypothetical protein [Microbulbifer sp. A4B17]
MSKPFVAISTGFDPDLPVMEAAFGVLEKFDIPCQQDLQLRKAK